jgi:uncharacterized protein YcbK (DUF882 family)
VVNLLVLQTVRAFFSCKLSDASYNNVTANYDDNGETMNRRHFLSLALSAAAAPAFARKQNNQHRTLCLRHLHTDERLQVTYRIGDHYQRDALNQLNRFLRDFRTGEVMVMDPRLFDLLYDLQYRAGHPQSEFEIFSAYRSPRTNAMLRRTSGGVARRSLHMSGKALDIRLNGCSNRTIRDSAIAMHRGGVGYYPRSSFVHLDTGPVRTWRA